MTIIQRPIDQAVYDSAKASGLSDLIARIIAGRVTAKDLANLNGRDLPSIIHPMLNDIEPPSSLLNATPSAQRILLAMQANKRIGILTDYDVDGITSHAIIKKSMVKYFEYPSELITSIIGQRLHDGYGVTDSLVNKILAVAEDKRPELIITADCGSSDYDRIQRLVDAGIEVIVTDHHVVPNGQIPANLVNPVQPGCPYKDKQIAGCMVAWLLMCELRRCIMDATPMCPSKMSSLLDYVALGTVADAVSLFSPTNRGVVTYGLSLINQFRRPCWRAFSAIRSSKANNGVTVSDLGFQLGPRINARSRMDDPYAALFYLMAESEDESIIHLKKLDANNEERKQMESLMIGEARKEMYLQSENHAVVVYNPEFHAGVQGIVASRIVEYSGKPTIIFSPIKDEMDLVTGSCRTIPGLDIRRCLQYVDDNSTDILAGFGGHVGAAGCKVRLKKLPEFRSLMDKAIEDQLGPSPDLSKKTLTDGPLLQTEFTLASCEEIQSLQPYGRGFEEPVFSGQFKIKDIRMIGTPAIHAALEFEDTKARAIWFRAVRKPGDEIPACYGDMVDCTYALSINEYNDRKYVQIVIKDLAKSKV